MSNVVIVTGASGGLGREVALKFGLSGDRVTVHYYRAWEPAEGVANRINQAKGEAFTYKADVRSFQEIKAMVEATVERWGRVDALVCCSGGPLRFLAIGSEDKLLVDHEEGDWDLVIDTNLKGPFNCIKAVAPVMMQQKEGHIILVGSGRGLRGAISLSSYSAAKAGLFGLMKSAARELGEFNIRVNAVNPGRIVGAYRNRYRPEASTDITEKYLQEAVLHRHNTAEEFADFVFHLAQMKNTSGQILNTDSTILF